GNLWIGLEHGGLARYAQGKFITFTPKDGLPDSVIWRVGEDQRGHLWANTSLGPARLDGGRFSAEPSYFGLPSKDLVYRFAGQDGSLWFSMPAGLARYFNGELMTYPLRASFICELKDGSVWAYNKDRGLVRYQVGTWTDYPIQQELPGHDAYGPVIFAGRD